MPAPRTRCARFSIRVPRRRTANRRPPSHISPSMPCASRRSTSLRLALFGILLAAVLATSACSISSRAQLARGQRFQEQNRPAAALALYDALLPVLPKSNTHTLSQVELWRGECLWQLARPAEAFSAFHKSADLDPDNLKARLRLAEVFLAGGSAQAAAEYANS